MKTVPLCKIFDIKYGVNLELSNIEQNKNGIPFVSRTGNNNGVSANVSLIEGVEPNPGNTISVAGGGSVMSSFLQKKPYYSGRDLYYLKPKTKLTDNEMLYYCMCLRANKYRYSYGRQANKTLDTLLVPSWDNIPDWVNIAEVKNPIKNEVFELKTKQWQYFKLVKLFEITGSQTISIWELEEYGVGKYPYITTQATNNGVGGFYDFYTEEGGCLTVDSAVIGYCSYQKDNFSASDHVEKLIPKFRMNKYTALFLTTIVNLEQYRYNYGRKCSQTRMKEINIKLPANNGNPD